MVFPITIKIMHIRNALPKFNIDSDTISSEVEIS